MGLVRLICLALAAPVLGCGAQASSQVSTDKPPLNVCQTFTPCHAGNVVGRWRLTRVCIDQDYLSTTMACGDAKGTESVTELTGYTATGTLEIDTDGSATLETDERAYEHSSHPAACSADPAAASAYCDMQRAAGASCSLTSGDCECNTVLESMWPTPTSTYTPGDTTTFGMDFCVNGAGLTLRNAGGGGDYVFVAE
jgi:hypothetical protein